MPRLRHIAAFLALGAALNITFVLTLVWFANVATAEIGAFDFRGAEVWRADTFGMTGLAWIPALLDEQPAGSLPFWSRLRAIPSPYPPIEEYSGVGSRLAHFEFAAGWPMRSMIYEYDLDLWSSSTTGYNIRSGIHLPPRQVVGDFGTQLQPRAIPLRVAPIGFAINTLLFAAAAALIWCAPPTIRRARRLRADLCLACGYSRAGLAQLARCPECGA